MDFDFGTSEPQKEENNNNEINTSEPTNQNNDGFLNMDFQTNQSQPQQQTALDDMLNMNFQSNPQQQNLNFDSNMNNMNMNLNNNLNNQVDEEEQKRLEAREKEAQERREKINQNQGGGSNADSWGRINSNIDLKDSEYKGTKDVQRMREAMMNRTNDPNSKPLEKFFG